jgi:hypothetical protein
MGRQESDGRKIYLLLETIEDAKIEMKFHWLTDETPCMALFLYPTIAAYFLWMHSHDVTKGA